MIARRAARPRSTSRWAVDRVLAAGRRRTAEALAILDEDREACRLIGEHGRAELPARAAAADALQHRPAGDRPGSGTALGVVYAKAAAGEQVEVLACETRPLLQGARLTAWELAATPASR